MCGAVGTGRWRLCGASSCMDILAKSLMRLQACAEWGFGGGGHMRLHEGLSYSLLSTATHKVSSAARPAPFPLLMANHARQALGPPWEKTRPSKTRCARSPGATVDHERGSEERGRGVDDRVVSRPTHPSTSSTCLHDPSFDPPSAPSRPSRSSRPVWPPCGRSRTGECCAERDGSGWGVMARRGNEEDEQGRKETRGMIGTLADARWQIEVGQEH